MTTPAEPDPALDLDDDDDFLFEIEDLRDEVAELQAELDDLRIEPDAMPREVFKALIHHLRGWPAARWTALSHLIEEDHP